MSTDGSGGVQASVAFDSSEVDRGVAILRDAVGQSEAAIKELQSSLAAGSVTAIEFATQLKELQTQHRQLEAAAKSLEATQRATASGMLEAAQKAAEAVEAQRRAAEATGPKANSVFSTAQINAADKDLEKQMYDAASAAIEREDAAFRQASAGSSQYRQSVESIIAANQQHVVSAGQVVAATQQVATAQAGVSPRTMAATRAITDFSRAAEDFSTGGFLGVMNNIPGVLTNTGQALNVAAAKLALFTAGVSIAVAVGYMMYKNWDSITGLFEERNPFPKTTESIEGMTEAIKTNDKALDELRKKESLNNAELKKANDLLAENIRLEKEREEARTVKKNAEEFAKAPTDEVKEQGKGFEDAFKGMGKEVSAALALAFESDKAERALAKIKEIEALSAKVQAGDFQAFKQRQAAQAELKKIEGESAQGNANKLISDIKENVPGAFDRFRGMMGGPMAGRFTPEMRAKLNENDPKIKKSIGKDDNRRKLDDDIQKMIEKKELEDYDREAEDFQREIDRRKDAIDRRQVRERTKKQQDAEKKRKETAADKEALKAAEKAVPGADKVAEEMILRRRAGGMGGDDASDKTEVDLHRMLREAGMDFDQADRASRLIAGKATIGVQEDVVARRLKLEDQAARPAKNSEVFGIESLSNKIQSGVGSDERADRKKLLNLNEQMLNHLARQIPMAIAKAKGNVNLGVR